MRNTRRKLGFSADENGGVLTADYSLLEDIGEEAEITVNNLQSGE